MAVPTCPDCEVDLDHNDTFGNLDHCLNAIGYADPNPYAHRQPVKVGDIWKCPECGECFYTCDEGDDELHRGYPC